MVEKEKVLLGRVLSKNDRIKLRDPSTQQEIQSALELNKATGYLCGHKLFKTFYAMFGLKFKLLEMQNPLKSCSCQWKGGLVISYSSIK